MKLVYSSIIDLETNLQIYLNNVESVVIMKHEKT